MACKQRTGSAFGFNAWFHQQDVRIEGRATEFVRVGDEGGRITFRFCPNCGTTVFWNIDRIPGTIAIAAGSFADMSFPPPAVSVYESRRYPWVEIRTDQLEKNVRG
jgi:hypothetical protein